MATDKYLYLKTSLKYLQKTLHDQTSGIDIIKTNVRAVLSAASLIVSLVGAMQFLTLNVKSDWIWLYHTGVIIVAVLYIALIVVCILALWPTYVVGPVSADWETLVTYFQGESEKEILEKELSAVLNAIESNKDIVKRYRNLQVATLILLPVIVTIMLSMALIPRQLP